MSIVEESYSSYGQRNLKVNSQPYAADSESNGVDSMSDSRLDSHHSKRPGSLPELDTTAHNSLPRFSTLSSVSLSSPGPASVADPHPTPSKTSSTPRHSPTQPVVEGWRSWSFNTYKFARQLVSERLGRSDRTVDAALEAQIAGLREVHSKYTHLLNLAHALTNHFFYSMTTQRKLGESFSELALMNCELCEAFTRNADTQKVLARNGEHLLRALNTFTLTLTTLCNKTFTDTLSTVKQYEAARIEYDAYRLDLDTLLKGSRDNASTQKIAEAEARYQTYKEKYERLRADVDIKIKFLDENRVKVMRKQLLMFYSAVSSYFSGNQIGLEETLKQFNICTSIPNT